jgi:hypothetical protein
MQQIIGLLTRDKQIPVSVYTNGSTTEHATIDGTTTMCGITTNDTYWTFSEMSQQKALKHLTCRRCGKKLGLKPEEE